MLMGVDFIEYENIPIKLIAAMHIMRIVTPGLVIDEVDERGEFMVPFWIAGILVETGLAKFEEEGLTIEDWTSMTSCRA